MSTYAVMKQKETLLPKGAGRQGRRRSLLAVLLFLPVLSLFLLQGINAFVPTRSPRSPGRQLLHAGAERVDVMDRVKVDEKSEKSDELLQASALLEEEMAKVENELRRANAFKLPERDGLKSQADSLRVKIKEIADELDKLQKTSEPVVAEASAEAAQEMASTAASPTEKIPLSERLSWEKLEAMSNEERMALTQEIGPAFGVSVGIVAFVYWSITLPILLNAYYQSTGEWPRFEEIFSLSDGGRTAGAVAGILGLAALMKPLRIAAAIALTPWTADNVLPLIPWLSPAKKEEKDEK